MERRTVRADEAKSQEDRILPGQVLAKARDLVLALLCIAPPLYLSPYLPTLHTLEDNKWLVVVFLALVEIVLVAAAKASQLPAARLSRSRTAWMVLFGIGALMTAHLVSVALSRQPAVSFRAAIAPLSLMVLSAALIWQAPEPRAIRRVTVVLLATGGLIGGCALLQHVGLDPLASVVRYREAGRYRAVYVTFGNPEYLAGYLAPIALLAGGLALSQTNRTARYAAGAVCALAAIPVFLSGARGALVGLIVGTLVLWMGARAALHFRLSISPRLVATVGTMVALAAIIFAFAPRDTAVGRWRNRLLDAANPHSGSIRERIVFNLVGLEIVARQPIVGVGPGRFGVEFYPAFLRLVERDQGVGMAVVARDFNGGVAEHAHNDWLELWAETGSVGLATWLWIVAAFAVAIVRCVRNRSAPADDKVLLVTLASAITGLLVNALFNFPLHEPVRAALFWMLLAWSVCLVRPNEMKGPQ